LKQETYLVANPDSISIIQKCPFLNLPLRLEFLMMKSSIDEHVNGIVRTEIDL
jgi:hypothetical protein